MNRSGLVDRLDSSVPSRGREGKQGSWDGWTGTSSVGGADDGRTTVAQQRPRTTTTILVTHSSSTSTSWAWSFGDSPAAAGGTPLRLVRPWWPAAASRRNAVAPGSSVVAGLRCRPAALLPKLLSSRVSHTLLHSVSNESPI